MASQVATRSLTTKHGRCSNGFNNYCSEMSNREDIKQLAPTKRFAVFSREWRALSSEDKEKYKNKEKLQPLDMKKRKRKWQKTFTKICKSIQHLQSLLPTEAVVMVSVNKSAPTCAGTNAGIEFVEGDEGIEMCQNFQAFLKREAGGANEVVTLKKIQDLFNSKFAEAAGLPVGKLPYSSQSVTMRGLPDGIVFKKPSHYGKTQRKKIWSARASISCHIMQENNESV